MKESSEITLKKWKPVLVSALFPYKPSDELIILIGVYLSNMHYQDLVENGNKLLMKFTFEIHKIITRNNTPDEINLYYKIFEPMKLRKYKLDKIINKQKNNN